MGILLLIVTISFVGIIYWVWKQSSNRINKLYEEINRMRLQIELDRFEMHSPPKFKQGDKIGNIFVTTFVNKYDNNREECYRKYTCFNEKYSIIKEYEEGELMKFQEDLSQNKLITENNEK